MTSREPDRDGAFVWIWLPGAVAPVVAGRLVRRDGTLRFLYGRSYLRRDDRIGIYAPELPLEAGLLPLPPGLSMPGAIRDAAPDAWGRRVIMNRTFGAGGRDRDTADLDELTYLLRSGSDRIGALDFQDSATDHVPREATATLDDLIASAARVERNVPLSPDLDEALFHGTSIGGARPKALVTDGDRKLVAKFSSSADLYSVVKAEFVAMRLARLVGIDAAPVALTRAAGRDVLLIERFDRKAALGGWHRRAMVSALTVLGLDEMMARYASYEDLAEQVRHRFTAPDATLAELFARIVFNILAGNIDDHARNHAAFWDGHALTLTPAYDICPQPRSGQEAGQAMLVVGNDRSSRLETALAAAPLFRLSEERAIALARDQIAGIGRHWHAVCDLAGLGPVDRAVLWGRQFLNPYLSADLRPAARALGALADRIRDANAA